MTTTARLAMAYLVTSQAQKEATHNDALNDLDFVVQASVISRTLATPPTSPATGDAYIIAASPTGAWANAAGCVAAYYSGWKIKTPKVGWVVWSQSESRALYYTGSAWAVLAVPILDATASLSPGTLAAGAGVTLSAVTVTGAALGDVAMVAAPYDLQGLTVTAYVSAANSVTIRIVNTTATSVTLAAGSWRVRVQKA